MPPWKSKSVAVASEKDSTKSQDKGEEEDPSKGKQVATIPKTPTLPKVAIQWAVDPVNDNEWPGAADFAEIMTAQIAKGNDASKAVIRLVYTHK